MPRPVRVFRPEAAGLEGRQLLTASAVPRSTPPPQVEFVGGAPDGSIKVSQQATSLTVTLLRTQAQTPLQVRVATIPSAAIGVNVGAVDQTVTFNAGQTETTVNVPIIPGAPNPQEVDAQLSLTPINAPSNLVASGPLELRVMANTDLIPPTILSARRTPAGIELRFSKPMDPVRAMNVANYSLHGSTKKESDTKSILSAVFLGKWSGLGSTTYSGPVRLRAAMYNPATWTVTLIPARPIDLSAQLNVTSALQARLRVRPRGHAKPIQPLTDLAGNPIAGNMGPGEFYVAVPPVRAN